MYDCNFVLCIINRKLGKKKGTFTAIIALSSILLYLNGLTCYLHVTLF